MRYTDSVLLHVLKNLIEHANSINARGAIMMLINGRLWSHKKRDNLRMMKNFSLRAIGCLVRERDSLGDEFEQYCVQYYDLTKEYCLKNEDLVDVQQMFQDQLKLDIVALQNQSNLFAANSSTTLMNTSNAAMEEQDNTVESGTDLLGRLLMEKQANRASSIDEAYAAIINEDLNTRSSQ